MRNNRTADDFTPEWKAKISAAKKGGKTWNKGRAVPEEQKSRQSATRKSKTGTPGFNTRPACRPEKAKAISVALTGKKWIYNPNTPADRKYLDPDKCLHYLSLGWKFGFGTRPTVVKKECTHCNRFLDPGNYQLHHGDKCRSRHLVEVSRNQSIIATFIKVLNQFANDIGSG